MALISRVCRLGATVALSLTMATHARAAEVWLAPSFALPNNVMHVHGPPDYLTLFDSADVWPRARRRVQVFKIYAGVVKGLEDDQLTNIFSRLKQYHIALALEAGAMTPTDQCGKGVEGYFGPHLADTVRKIKRLGGDVAYLAMDEPLWYGSDYSGPRGCQRPIGDVARDVAGHVAEVREVFPNVQVGDVEPIGQPRGVDWLGDLRRWETEFQRASGRPLAFMHADVLWLQDWRGPLAEMSRDLQRRQIPLGVIFNGLAQDGSDEAWMRHTFEHIGEVNRDGVELNAAVFQSWRSFPSRVGPETARGSMTNLVLRYIEGGGS